MNVELKQEQNEQLKVIAEQLSDVVVELKIQNELMNSIIRRTADDAGRVRVDVRGTIDANSY